MAKEKVSKNIQKYHRLKELCMGITISKELFERMTHYRFRLKKSPSRDEFVRRAIEYYMEKKQG